MAATSVIPSADKALLAAQATAGPAGVDAYEAAKRELAAQQAAAVAQAQAEAQRRGSPTGALSAASGAASGMYDQRIASLTEAQGIAAAQGAMREQRMVDYGGAVNQARGLIADQAAQTVAPINAETNFRIRSLERQGQNDVDRIEAQIRLEAARAAAEAAAAASRGGGGGGRGGGGGGGGGGGSLPKPNATELRAAMTNRSQTKMGNAIGTAQQAMRQTAEQNRQAASYAGKAAQEYALKQARPKVSRAQQEADRQAVAYTGRSVTAPQQRAQPAWQQSVARKALDTVVGQQKDNLGVTAALTAGRPAAQRIAPLYFDDTQSMFTPAQIARFAQSPDASLYSYLLPGDGATPVRRIRGVDERLGGAPQYADQGAFKLGELARDAAGNMIRDNRRDGEVDELSRSAMRDAMMLSAFDMQDEGYKIDDNEILAAVDADSAWKAGSTYADVAGRSQGRGSIADQQAAADRAAAATGEVLTDEQQKMLDDQTETERQAFTQTTGLDPNKYGQWRPDQLVEMIADPKFQAAVDVASTARDRDDAVRKLTEDAGLSTADPYDRTIIAIVADMLNV